MSVTPEDTARHLDALQSQRGLRGQERAQWLVDRLPAAREVLLGPLGARRAWVFGSLATESATEDSDVDLAVEHLPPESYFDALAALMAIFGSPVDLVRLEDASASLRERILSEGRPL